MQQGAGLYAPVVALEAQEVPGHPERSSSPLLCISSSPPLPVPITGAPKVLTVMGKMVQQIATANNLLIFINICKWPNFKKIE